MVSPIGSTWVRDDRQLRRARFGGFYNVVLVVEAIAALAIFAFMRLLPRPLSLSVGSALGTLARWFGRRVRLADRNLMLAFPSLTPAHRRVLLATAYRRLGRYASDYTRVPELIRHSTSNPIRRVLGREHLDAVKRQGRGAILVSAHYGPYELLAAWVAREYGLTIVVKPLENQYIEQLLRWLRHRYGAREIRTDASLRRVVRALQQPGFVGMLVDQDEGHGIVVPFFGHPICANDIPARLSMHLGVPLVSGYIYNCDRGLEITIAPAIEPRHNRSDEEAYRITRKYIGELENCIQQRPSEWFWLHDRWGRLQQEGGCESRGSRSAASTQHSRPT